MVKQLGVKELSEAQQDMVSNLCESVVCSQTKEYWGETLESCVKDFNEIETLQTLKEVLDISAKHSLEAISLPPSYIIAMKPNLKSDHS